MIWKNNVTPRSCLPSKAGLEGQRFHATHLLTFTLVDRSAPALLCLRDDSTLHSLVRPDNAIDTHDNIVP